MNRKWWKWIVGGVALAAVPVAVGVFGVSMVQASTGSTSSVAFSAFTFHGIFGEAIDMQALLADELGISVDELDVAQQAAFEAGLAIAVAEGMLTQEQADQILAGDHLFRFGLGRGFGPGRGEFKGELPEGFEPGEGFGPGRGRWQPFGPQDAPQEDTSNTSNA